MNLPQSIALGCAILQLSLNQLRSLLGLLAIVIASSHCPLLLGGEAILDLRQRELSTEYPFLPLSIPWNYAPHQLADPFDPAPFDDLRLGQPDLFWVKAVLNPDLGEISQASFRLRLLADPQADSMVLWIPGYFLYRLYVNGLLASEQGTFSTATDPSKPKRGHRLVVLPRVAELNLLLQVERGPPRWQQSPQPILLGPSWAVIQDFYQRSLGLAFILGGILLIGCYHCMLWLLNRSRWATLALAAFCLVSVLRSWLGNNGLIAFIMAPELPFELSYRLAYACYFVSGPLYLIYLYSTFPGIINRKILQIFTLISLGFTSVCFVSSVPFFASITIWYHPLLFFGFVLSWHALAKACQQNMHGAKTLLFGSIVLSFVAMHDILKIIGAIKTPELFQYAVLGFVFLKSYVLSASFAKAVRDLQHTYKELSKFAYLHMVQRIAEGAAIEETMPTGHHNAVIIAFDIVGSSRIVHPDFAHSLERLMGRCYEAISQTYDPKAMEASAYRIKEMGDGLLCSVGFPFQLKTGESQVMVALALSKKFCQLFKEEIEQLDLPHPSFCAIGLAMGKIEGFFPRFGIKQYDLRGTPIILATRYEAMRNRVYARDGHLGSVIFIQDQVFQNLSAETQEEFRLWDCRDAKNRIRDDPTALQAWYSFEAYAEAKNDNKAEEGPIEMGQEISRKIS